MTSQCFTIKVDPVNVVPNVATVVVSPTSTTIQVLTCNVEIERTGNALGFLENPVTLAENIGQYKLLIIDSDELAHLANASDINDAHKVAGISLDNGLSGNQIDIVFLGIVENPAWNWDKDKPLFMGDNGNIVQTPTPSDPFIQQIGVPLEKNRILFNPQRAIVIDT